MVFMVIFCLVYCVLSLHYDHPKPPHWESGSLYKFQTDSGNGVGEFIFNLHSSSSKKNDDLTPNGWVVKFQSEQIPLGYKIFNHDSGINTAITLDKTTNFTTEICLHFPKERPVSIQPCLTGKYIGTRKILMETYPVKQYKYVDMWQSCNFTNYLDYFGRHVYGPFTFFQDLFDNIKTWKICLGNVEPEDCETFLEIYDYQILNQDQITDSFSEPWLCNQQQSSRKKV